MVNLKQPIVLRPHHGLCLQHFEGKGYSRNFVENMGAVLTQLTENPALMVQLRCSTDVLCSCCPHNQNSRCESGQKVAQYDSTCLALCGLQEGDILPWGKFRQLVQKNILQRGRLCEVCRNCEWLTICSKKK